MTYKIRRSNSRIKVFKGIENNQIRQHQKVIEILKLEIENLNLELHCKIYELEYIKSSRDIENEVNSLVISVLLNSSDEHELSKKLVELDKLINNLINKLLDGLYASKYSAIPQQ
jgi:hypothetical protein